MLGNVVTYQYAYYTFIMTPGKYTKRELMMFPFVLSLVGGVGFGFLEIAMNPMRNMKPKLHMINQ